MRAYVRNDEGTYTTFFELDETVLSPHVMTTLRIALLLCDTPVSNAGMGRAEHSFPQSWPSMEHVRWVQLGKADADLDIYRHWLETSLKSYPDDAANGTELVLHGYDVVQMKYPTDEQLEEYDIVMLTGSSGFGGDRADSQGTRLMT